jgi:hypothetical protein
MFFVVKLLWSLIPGLFAVLGHAKKLMLKT